MKTLLTNAWLVTVDAAMTEHRTGWLMVEDGRIAALGGGAPPQVSAGTQVRDMAGDIVMPGMVNPHCHMAMSLFRGLGEDVDDRLFRYMLPLERKFVSPEMVRVGSTLSALEMIMGGVTCVADMYYHETEVADVIMASGMRGVVGHGVLRRSPAPESPSIDRRSGPSSPGDRGRAAAPPGRTRWPQGRGAARPPRIGSAGQPCRVLACA